MKHNLDEPIKVYNVDGTENKRGTIRQYVNLSFNIGTKQFKEKLYVTGLGKQKIILGFPWIQEHNPLIDWKKGTIEWRMKEPRKMVFQWRKKKIEEEMKKEDTSMMEESPKLIQVMETMEPKEEIWINAKTNLAMDLAIEENLMKEDKSPREIVPQEYHEYLDVFDEEKANRFPESRPWDHKIELKEGFEPKSFKNYNLSPAEQIELDKFLKENLEKGYIRPSQSPMASPFFFVNKKDGKLRPCQDYRYLNDWTIKNAYPLPLISEIMDKLKGTKYFTKLDVRWGYNNIWIKEGDQWKAVFKTNRGLFEPTVMFFGMCNSPATFQAM